MSACVQPTLHSPRYIQQGIALSLHAHGACVTDASSKCALQTGLRMCKSAHVTRQPLWRTLLPVRWRQLPSQRLARQLGRSRCSETGFQLHWKGTLISFCDPAHHQPRVWQQGNMRAHMRCLCT